MTFLCILLNFVLYAADKYVSDKLDNDQKKIVHLFWLLLITIVNCNNAIMTVIVFINVTVLNVIIIRGRAFIQCAIILLFHFDSNTSF